MKRLTTSHHSGPEKRARQIIGFSLDPSMAREVKTDAARKGLSLKKLFEEMWQTYKQHDETGPKGHQ